MTILYFGGEKLAAAGVQLDTYKYNGDVWTVG
jgi:hypothetical protein